MHGMSVRDHGQEETCLPALCRIFSDLRRMRPDDAAAPPVVLSEDLQRDPEGTLRALCAALDVEGLDFSPKMLAWEPGPRPNIDGVWAPWWYKNTHASGGFEQIRPKPPVPMSDAIRRLVEEARPFYYLLRRHALRPLPAQEWGWAAADDDANGKRRRTHDGADATDETDAKERKETEKQSEREAKRERRELGGTHAYAADSRNADVLIGVRDGVRDTFELVWRPEAKVSVFDAGFVLGDGVWEGIRLHGGVLLFVREHIKRLYQGAKVRRCPHYAAPRTIRSNVHAVPQCRCYCVYSLNALLGVCPLAQWNVRKKKRNVV